MKISELVKRYQAQLKGFIRSRVNTDEDAEDILQNVFFQLVKANSLMLPIEQVSAWLYSVARNQITDLWRKKKTEAIPEYMNNDNESILEEFAEMFDDKESTPETEYMRSVIWQELEAALAELPKEQSEVFEQTELQGFSFKEIAEKTGITINTLISRKRYAVLHLRVRLADLYTEFFEL